jgi:hypothetical protein
MVLSPYYVIDFLGKRITFAETVSSSSSGHLPMVSVPLSKNRPDGKLKDRRHHQGMRGMQRGNG